MTTRRRQAPGREVDRAGEIEAALGHTFKDRSLLALALVHPSASAGADYQRLEFLGDRVVNLLAAEALYRLFPDEAEGALSRRYHGIVSGEALAQVAAELGFGRALVVAPGIDGPGLRGNPTVLGDLFEALMGALYLDAGLEAVRQFLTPHIRRRLEAGADSGLSAKNALQEWSQGRGLPLPAYRLLGRDGPDHAPRFDVEVTVAGFPPAVGSGPSRRAAEAAAATALLARLTDLPNPATT